jgi:hypothetical protein
MAVVEDISVMKRVARLRQQCHNSKCVIFQERLLKVLKCCNFLRVQRRHNCSPVASFANCVMILYLLKVRMQTFLSIPITKKCQILSCDTLVASERYVCSVCRCPCCMCHTFMPIGDETNQSQVTEISTRKRAAYTWNRGDFEEGSSLLGTGLHAWWKNQTDSHISGRSG